MLCELHEKQLKFLKTQYLMHLRLIDYLELLHITISGTYNQLIA